MNTKDMIFTAVTMLLLGLLLFFISLSFSCKTTDEIDTEYKVIVGQIMQCEAGYVLENIDSYEFYYIETAQDPIHEKIGKKKTYILFDKECLLYKKIYVNGVFRCNILWLPYPEAIVKRKYL